MDIQSVELNELFDLVPIIIPGWVTPVLPAGTAHGGIARQLYDGEPKGLECLVDPWAEIQVMAVDDRVSLYVNDSTIPVDGKTIASGEEQQRIRLYVPHGELRDGVNRLHYKVVRPSGNSDDSRDLTVLYHRAPAETLDLAIPADVLQNGVSAERAAQGVELGFIYYNRRAYDRVRLDVGLARIEWTVADDGAPITRTLLTDTFLQAGDNPATAVSYTVIDQLGNRSTSAVQRLDIHVRRFDLEAPTVKGMTGDTFSPTLPEIRVMVPQGSLMPTDKVSVIWKGATANAAGSYTSPQRLVSAGLEVAVPRSVLAFNLGQAVTVSYVIERDGKSSPSQILKLNILTLPDAVLIAPIIVEANDNNVIDVTALGSKDATLHGKSWPLIDAGQQVFLDLEGTKADGSAHNLRFWSGGTHKVNATWVAEGFWPKPILLKYLKELGTGTTLTLKFKASLDKSNSEANAVVFPLRRYTINAVADVVPVISSVKGLPSGADISNGGSTSETTVELVGSGAAGQIVEIYDGTALLGQATVDANGQWRWQALDLAEGEHRFTAKTSSGTASTPWLVNVTAATIELVPPFFVKPVASPIDSLEHPKGVIMRVEHLAALAGDRARLVEVKAPAGAPAFELKEFNENKRTNTVLTPAFLTARQGRKDVQVRWNLNRDGKQVGRSPVLEFEVKKIDDGDTRLPMPVIAGETGPVLDVSALKEGDKLTVAPWIGQEVGQLVWLKYEGIGKDGRPVEKVVWDGEPLTSSSGVEIAAEVEWLCALKNESKLSIVFGVNFTGVVASQSKVNFPTRSYNAEATRAEKPVITEVKGYIFHQSYIGPNVPRDSVTMFEKVLLWGTDEIGNQSIEIYDGENLISKAEVVDGAWGPVHAQIPLGDHKFTARSLSNGNPISEEYRITRKMNRPPRFLGVRPHPTEYGWVIILGDFPSLAFPRIGAQYYFGVLNGGGEIAAGGTSFQDSNLSSSISQQLADPTFGTYSAVFTTV